MLKQQYLTLIALTAVALVGMATKGTAEDWPRWRGSRFDGISRETGLLKAWPQGGPKVIWQVNLGPGYSAVSVANGRVFTMFQDGAGQWTIALNEKTGEPIWKVRTGDVFENGDFDGPRMQPTVDGDRVYVLDALGNLLCLAVEGGKEIWKKNILQETGTKNLGWGMAASPLIDGKTLYVSAGEPTAATGQGGTMLALDKMTGKPIWKSVSVKGSYGSPIMARIGGTKQVIEHLGPFAVGVAPDSGKLLWKFPWARDINPALPIVEGSDVFLSSGYGNGACRLKIDLTQTTPTTVVWRIKNKGSQTGQMTLYQGGLYLFDAGKLTCLDPKTGQTKWAQDGFGNGSMIIADGLAYLKADTGRVVLARLSPEKYEPISVVDGLMKGPRAWTMPVVAGGRLYLRDETRLVCLDIKAK